MVGLPPRQVVSRMLLLRQILRSSDRAKQAENIGAYCYENGCITYYILSNVNHEFWWKASEVRHARPISASFTPSVDGVAVVLFPA